MRCLRYRGGRKRTAVGREETIAIVTIRNPSPHLAFGISWRCAGSDGLEVGPTYWSDNYFSLLPGEERRIDRRITTAPERREGRVAWMVGMSARRPPPIRQSGARRNR